MTRITRDASNGIDHPGTRRLTRYVTTLRLFVGTLVIAGLLAGLSGIAPPAARAIPPDDPGGGPELCVPQTVGGADAQLVGTPRLLDQSKPPVTGQETRIIMQSAAIRLPDPDCEGRELNWTSFPAHWSVVSRPAGSTTTPTVVGTNTAALVPDRGGAWTVAYTACPSNCSIKRVGIPPQTREFSFTVTAVAELRMSNADFQLALDVLLSGTRIQISHTGNGTTAPGTPYTVRWNMPLYKYDDICENPNKPPPAWCADGPQPREKTFHTRTPQLWSYIDFGQAAEAAGAPNTLPLPIYAIDRNLSIEARAALLALQGGPLNPLVWFDIDRIRLMANNLNVNLTDYLQRSWSIGGGGINLGMKLKSSDPSIVCEGHFKVKVGYVATLSQGWADELCPDFNLSRMDLAVKLIPTAADGLLTVSDAQVTAQLESQGVVESLVDVFRNATNEAAGEIQTKIRTKLLEEQTREDLGEVLTAAVKRIALQRGQPDVCRVVDAQVIGSDLVVHYQPPLPFLRQCSPLPGGDIVPVEPAAPAP